VATACSVAPGGRASAVTALVGARVQPFPESGAIDDGVVLVEGGKIIEVGPRAGVRLPAGATVIDCTGATLTAGFWNSHAHFTQAVWNDAAAAPAERLAEGLRAMLTKYGVVRVLDTGSLPANTLALRRRIESGEIPGPAIALASGSIVPVGGSPYY